MGQLKPYYGANGTNDARASVALRGEVMKSEGKPVKALRTPRKRVPRAQTQTGDHAPAAARSDPPAMQAETSVAEPLPHVATLPPPAQSPAVVAPATPRVAVADTSAASAQTAAPETNLPDFETMSRNAARLVEEGGRAMAAYLKPLEEGRTNADLADSVGDAVKTFGRVAEYWLADPKRTLQAQTAITTNFIDLWTNTLRRFSGEDAGEVVRTDPSDKRFSDPEWRENPIFDFLRQAYSLTTNWANDLVTHADSVDPATRERAQFYLRQIAGAVSPSNFLATNPELLRETLRENGENLVRGMQMFAEDVEAGKGQLKIRQSDPSKFELGVNMAVTPGKVVYRGDLFELIQYAPTTPEVYKRPLLIVPPWINKYYVLDLNPEKSFVRWAVSQGLTVFIISWVNPDERQAEKSFEDYMNEGVLAALDAIEKATGERHVTAIGYCVGGTLLAMTLAYMAQKGDTRISSATFFTTQVDFTDPGDLKHFVDEERIRSIEEKMDEAGFLEGARMASAFNMLRPNELIWSYVVNNYLKGKEPPPFDLLVWNSDSTRMPKANHSFYLRNCYLENNLTKGKIVLDNVRLDLGRVTIPVYNLAAKEDHIAPAKSVFNGAKFFGGEMRYVMAGSGHIAGVVNPAGKPKYQYWTGPRPEGEFEDWQKQAVEHPGTWWLDWIRWIADQAPEMIPARIPGEGGLPAICDAPGEYVRVKA